MKPIVGIDPGLSGGYAIMSLEGLLIEIGRLENVPLGKGKRKLVDANHLHSKLKAHETSHSVIEDVATRPGQGVVSSGNFMKAVGVCYGVASVVGGVTWVPPQTWKRHFGLLKQPKEASRQLAIKKFGPAHFKFKKDVDKAEAALIALWYVETRGKKLASLSNPPAVQQGADKHNADGDAGPKSETVPQG